MIDVLIITHNEALNLPRCLASLRGWTQQVFVLDSGSTDGTTDIAREYGAQAVHHSWEGYARQKNWGMANLPFAAHWTLILDADEVITPALRERLVEIASHDPASVSETGFYINRLSFFMDRPIRHCGYFPSWSLRFFKTGQGRYEHRDVHEHVLVDGQVGYVHEVMHHDDRRGLEHYIAKHNRYSTLEARSIFQELRRDGGPHDDAAIPAEARRRRWLKRYVLPRVPVPGLWRFLYMYVLRLGVLDGRAGLEYSRLIAMYDTMVAMKLRWLLRGDHDPVDHLNALASPEGSEPLTVTAAAPPGSGARERDRVELPRSSPQAPAASTNGASSSDPQPLPDAVQMQPEPSPWSSREKVGRALWMVVGRPLFRLSFHNWYRYRRLLLTLFRAKVGKRAAIRPTVHIEIPWTLHVEDDVTVGDYAILYGLGSIHIGKRVTISQYAHLCAGTHDYTNPRFPLIRAPINIEDDVWIGADAFIGPGVTVGRLSVVGARASAYKDLPPAKVYTGNPARPIKDRVLRAAAPAPAKSPRTGTRQ